jgi:hypothetical protein
MSPTGYISPVKAMLCDFLISLSILRHWAPDHGFQPCPGQRKSLLYRKGDSLIQTPGKSKGPSSRLACFALLWGDRGRSDTSRKSLSYRKGDSLIQTPGNSNLSRRPLRVLTVFGRRERAAPGLRQSTHFAPARGALKEKL